MRRFTTTDQLNGEHAVGPAVSEEVTLQELLECTDFSDEEANAIADLQPGGVLVFDNEPHITITRTA